MLIINITLACACAFNLAFHRSTGWEKHYLMRGAAQKCIALQTWYFKINEVSFLYNVYIYIIASAFFTNKGNFGYSLLKFILSFKNCFFLKFVLVLICFLTIFSFNIWQNMCTNQSNAIWFSIYIQAPINIDYLHISSLLFIIKCLSI